jgi:hypothetical protein|tara:strand:+ start:1393 stop:2397 length:1005 start_codon:yes stop_codon:yes gene_type:complete
MSDTQTNPEAEVESKQLSMFDVMYGSVDTNPEETSEVTASEPEAVEEEALEEEVEYTEADDGNTGEEYKVEAEEDDQGDLPQTYTVKVDGQEFEVSLDELQNGYQRQSDYTRKSQAVAEQRKAYEANLQSVQQEREQYNQVLANMSHYQNLELQKFTNVNWATLKEEDPMEYMEKRIEFQEAKDKIAQVQVEKQRVYEQTRSEVSEHLTKVVQEEAKKLVQALPEYSDPSSSLKNDLRHYALDLGFSENDINGITDHRVVLVLHKAMMNDSAAKSSGKKSKTIPKVVKSGSPESKNQRSRREIQSKRERLAKTGNVRDATNVFLDLLDNPKPKR